MGNCQAIDAASLVIQHPNGRVERLYWSVNAGDIMRTNPGHYVALVISLCLPKQQQQEEEEKEKKKHEDGAGPAGVRVTRVKLLKPTDTLVLGQAYRLISSQDVTKGLLAKRCSKMKKKELESTEMSTRVPEKQTSQLRMLGRAQGLDANEAETHESQETHGQKTGVPSASSRPRQWRPSLQSISEADFCINHNKQQK